MKYVPLLFLFLLFANCKKSGDNKCTAGIGGDIDVAVFAKHNGVTIPNYSTHIDTAFVKFNTLTSPGTSPSNYDTYFTGEEGEDHIHCNDLKCGSYFIYRIAYDPPPRPRL